MMDHLFDNLLDLVAQLDLGGNVANKKQTIQSADQFTEGYKGSPLDLFLTSKRVNQLSDALLTSDLKERAYLEFTMRYGQEKAEHRGNELTPVCGYAKYEYPQDGYIDKVQEDLDKLQKQMKPLKKKEKSMKDSIKDRKKELEESGEAKKIYETKTIRG